VAIASLAAGKSYLAVSDLGPNFFVDKNRDKVRLAKGMPLPVLSLILLLLLGVMLNI
jgi:hypothetical protein